MGWIFTKEDIKNSPSVRYGMETEDEMLNRQEAALFIDKLGYALGLSNLCIITAIILMHRFYMCHPLLYFPWGSVCCATILLATKLEEERRPIEYITNLGNYYLLHTNYDSQNQHEMLEIEEVKKSEELLLSSLGFDIDALGLSTPPRLILSLCEEVDVPRNVAQTSFLLAACSMFSSTLVLQYRTTVLTCFFLYQVCKWTDWRIRRTYDNQEWYNTFDTSINRYILEEIALDFQNQYKRCPRELKEKFVIITRYVNDDIVNKTINSSPDLFYPEFTKPTVTCNFNDEKKDPFPPLLDTVVKHGQRLKKRTPLEITTNRKNLREKKFRKPAKGKENQNVPHMSFKKRDENAGKK